MEETFREVAGLIAVAGLLAIIVAIQEAYRSARARHAARALAANRLRSPLSHVTRLDAEVGR